eukprot:TRINITY_DN55404_c0_g2_i1.p1 TRINITY_DN55404_c0_g2~~TRINITY_DN55404_c0_g2_i1.p1  ORF type:complete len:309 (-),score=107.87 TRINITY_DN55404_c0_g2_i1:199-1125(-)
MVSEAGGDNTGLQQQVRALEDQLRGERQRRRTAEQDKEILTEAAVRFERDRDTLIAASSEYQESLDREESQNQSLMNQIESLTDQIKELVADKSLLTGKFQHAEKQLLLLNDSCDELKRRLHEKKEDSASGMQQATKELAESKQTAAAEIRAIKLDFRERWDQALGLFKESTAQQTKKHQEAVRQLQHAMAADKVRMCGLTETQHELKQGLVQLSSELMQDTDSPNEEQRKLLLTELHKMMMLVDPATNSVEATELSEDTLSTADPDSVAGLLQEAAALDTMFSIDQSDILGVSLPRTPRSSSRDCNA